MWPAFVLYFSPLMTSASPLDHSYLLLYYPLLSSFHSFRSRLFKKQNNAASPLQEWSSSVNIVTILCTQESVEASHDNTSCSRITSRNANWCSNTDWGGPPPNDDLLDVSTDAAWYSSSGGQESHALLADMPSDSSFAAGLADGSVSPTQRWAVTQKMSTAVVRRKRGWTFLPAMIWVQELAVAYTMHT